MWVCGGCFGVFFGVGLVVTILFSFWLGLWLLATLWLLNVVSCLCVCTPCCGMFWVWLSYVGLFAFIGWFGLVVAPFPGFCFFGCLFVGCRGWYLLTPVGMFGGGLV